MDIQNKSGQLIHAKTTRSRHHGKMSARNSAHPLRYTNHSDNNSVMRMSGTLPLYDNGTAHDVPCITPARLKGVSEDMKSVLRHPDTKMAKLVNVWALREVCHGQGWYEEAMIFTCQGEVLDSGLGDPEYGLVEEAGLASDDEGKRTKVCREHRTERLMQQKKKRRQSGKPAYAKMAEPMRLDQAGKPEIASTKKVQRVRYPGRFI